MKCKIYLNDGEDHFFGFNLEKAELTMVHSFDLPDTMISPVDEKSIRLILEWIFRELNVGTEPISQAYREKMLRSLSVGDVVVLGETAWSVESFGWSKLTTQDLDYTITWDDELGRCPEK